MREYRNWWIALLVLAVLTPAGLYLPHVLKAGSVWGEWGIGEVKQRIGYAPAGMEREAGRWKAPLPEYALPGEEKAPLSRQSLSYILSAIVGIAACGAGGYLLARWLGRGR
ncbi:MAG TPA: PDGLE domain-containing protein [Candidatus Limnocylindrales bacterium]|nr:PDGLE domain-containing protein [Candidatus Limnocylindrales bacterium]